MAYQFRANVQGWGTPAATHGGFRGPSDWRAYADFCRQRYFLAVNPHVHAASVQRFVTTGRKTCTNLDCGAGNVAPGQSELAPRFGSLPASGRGGLIVEPFRTNLLKSDGVRHVLPSSTLPLAAYSLDAEPLRVVARQGLVVVRGSGTVNDPLLLTHDRGRIDFEYHGNPDRICVEELQGGSSPSIGRINSVTCDECRIEEFLPAAGLAEGSIVFHFIEHPVSVPDAEEARSLFSLDFGTRYLSCRRQRKEQWLDVLPSSGRKLSFQLPSLENTVAFCWKNNNSAMAINGSFKALAFKPVSCLQRAIIGNVIDGTAFPLGGIVPAAVCFDRALSPAELVTSSLSWR